MEYEYLKVEWKHDIEDEPVLLYSELDSHRMELRKVEVYKNGRSDVAEKQRTTGKTKLSIEPLPSLEDIAADSQFIPAEITQREFEAAWNKNGEHE
ncbi:hypothetical protein Pla110_13490 [Polystyrenella longa]|uniref:DUF6881 domain-containing protein n=1 Tax=Polystyrenella longa TaxID=2528007 RepID=A0A518CK84_9PLAN|nr:hypothetical protein [Polystyrenella longa]QDU79638.1 hypothetical protein Pla110_13490 [Polystyrenella longa]